jgi:hypothetical protein
MNHIVRISVLASSAVDRGFDLRSGQKTTCWPHQVTTSLYWQSNHVGDVRISVLASSAVDRGFDPRSGQKTTCWPHQVTTSLYWQSNHIGDVRISVLASSAVDRGFDPRSGQTKDDKIGICCFAAKHAALRNKSKDWLTRNQDNVSEWGVLLFQ